MKQTKEQHRLTILRATLQANNLKRHYLYAVRRIPQPLLITLKRGKKQEIKNLLTEYYVSRDLFNRIFLSNISLEFLTEYTRKLALKTGLETLFRYYNMLSEIDYRKPRRINKISVEELRQQLEFPCHFVDCTNEREIRYPEHIMNNTYCLECIKNKFDENLVPTILKQWKPIIDAEALELAKELGRLEGIATFDKLQLLCSTRKPKERRYGWYGSYSITKGITLYLRQFNSESEIIETYIHELSHHFNPDLHGKLFQEFCKLLLQKLNIIPYKFTTRKNGEINYTFIMDVKLPKIPQINKMEK